MSVSVSPGGSTRGSSRTSAFPLPPPFVTVHLTPCFKSWRKMCKEWRVIGQIIECPLRTMKMVLSNDFTWVQTGQKPMDFGLQNPQTSMTPNPKRGYSATYAVMTVGAAISNDTSAGCERKTAAMMIHTAILPVFAPKTVEMQCRVLYRVQKMVSDVILLHLKHKNIARRHKLALNERNYLNSLRLHPKFDKLPRFP